MSNLSILPRSAHAALTFVRLALSAMLLVCHTGLDAAPTKTTADNTAALTNFAFASYLGTGFYRTPNQRVFVFQIPLEHTIVEKTGSRPGWVLKLPLTFGLLDFEEIDAGNIPDLNSIGTLTFLPGIEYQYPVTRDWTLIPFFDYGFARDLSNDRNILLIGSGLKSYADFRFAGGTLTLGNKFLFARESTRRSQSDASYSVLETAFNYRLHRHFCDRQHCRFNVYFIHYDYPNNLIFLEETPNPIRVGAENEVGFTISDLPDLLFFRKPQLGFGIRLGNNITVYRLIYGMPF